MSKEYVCSSRLRINGSWTQWRLLGFNPNLEYARNDLIDVLSMYLDREDRGEKMEAEWKELIEKAKMLEIGDVLECDERQWRITLGYCGMDFGSEGLP